MISAPPSGYWDQHPYDARCEWGPRGVAALGPISDVVIIVDVISFSTCVDIAVARGAMVYPFGWGDAGAADFARRIGGEVVGLGNERLRFSATAMLAVQMGARLVLPSPNGGALSALAAAGPVVFTGCLRNARAVAAAAARVGRRVAVIPAGERWGEDAHGDRSLRPAVEDLIGAGAILDRLSGRRSPEAELAVAAYRAVRDRLPVFLLACSSGREHAAKGTEGDVALAAQLDVSDFAPRLVDGAYVAGAGEAP